MLLQDVQLRAVNASAGICSWGSLECSPRLAIFARKGREEKREEKKGIGKANGGKEKGRGGKGKINLPSKNSGYSFNPKYYISSITLYYTHWVHSVT